MSSRLATTAAIVLTIALADTAAAQTEVVVAGTPPGPTLQVADATDGSLDLTLEVPGDTEPETDFERDDPPLWPDEAIVATNANEGAGGTTEVWIGGAVSAAAATVEVGFDGGHVVRLPTLAGEAYTGPNAGRVRFFLGTITLPERHASDNQVSVRTLDAAGTVIGVPESPDVERREVVLRGRAGGALVRVDAVLTSRLDAVALAPEHRTDELCMRGGGPERHRHAGGGLRGAGPADGARRQARLRPRADDAGGVRPPEAQSLVVRLGTGRTVTVPTRAAPFGRPVRMVASVLPRGEAVRSARSRAAGAVDLTDRRALRGRRTSPPA